MEHWLVLTLPKFIFIVHNWRQVSFDYPEVSAPMCMCIHTCIWASWMDIFIYFY